MRKLWSRPGVVAPRPSNAILLIAAMALLAGVLASPPASAHCCSGYIQCRTCPIGTPGCNGFTTYCGDCSFWVTGLFGGKCCSSVNQTWSCNIFCCNCDYPCIEDTSEFCAPNCGPLQNTCTCTKSAGTKSPVPNSTPEALAKRLQADKARFDSIDTDHDGRISKAEAGKSLFKDPEQPTTEERTQLDTQFDKLDADKSGFLEVAEFDRDLAAYVASLRKSP
jgi:hypothetical protein